MNDDAMLPAPEETPPPAEDRAPDPEMRLDQLEHELTQAKDGASHMLGLFKKKQRELSDAIDQKPSKADLNELDRKMRDMQFQHRAFERQVSADFAGINDRLDAFKRDFEVLIAKLNRPKIKALLDSDDSGTSRVRAGDGASKETIRRDYSNLIKKINWTLVKKLDNEWHNRADSAALCKRAIGELLGRLDSPLRNSALLEDFRHDLPGEGASDRLLDDDQVSYLAGLFANILRLMATLDYRIRATPTDFPRVVSTLGGEDQEVIHDGTVATAYAAGGA